MQHFDYAERLKRLNALVAEAPGEPRNYCALAEILAELGEHEKALECYARAEIIAPDSVEGAIALAQIVKDHAESVGRALPKIEGIAARSGAPRLAARLAQLLRDVGRYEEGYALCAAVDPADLDAVSAVAAARVAYAVGQWEACAGFYLRAVAADPYFAVTTIFANDVGPLVRALERTERRRDFAKVIEELGEEYHDVSYMMPPQSTPQLLESKNRRRALIERGLPSCALVTMAMSGSALVSQVINEGFHLVAQAHALGDVVIETWARDFARGGSFHNTHLIPTADNIAALKRAGISRVLVHVRDPRQQVLSLLVHYEPQETDYFNRTYGISALGPEALAARALDHGWDRSIAWLEGWLEASDTLDVRFTTFEEMKTEPVNFTTRLVQHYGGPLDEFDGHAAVTRIESADYRFRKGEIDEWRKVFTAEQRARVNDTLPREVAARFGWKV